MVWDTKYTDVKTGIYNLMQADSYLQVDGTYGVKQIVKGNKPVALNYPLIMIEVLRDYPDDSLSEHGMELGGSSGNIYHRIMEGAIVVYNHFHGAKVIDIFDGHTPSDGVYRYGLYQITAYLTEFLTSEYTVNNNIWIMNWMGSTFSQGDEDIPCHSFTEFKCHYQQTIAYS